MGRYTEPSADNICVVPSAMHRCLSLRHLSNANLYRYIHICFCVHEMRAFFGGSGV